MRDLGTDTVTQDATDGSVTVEATTDEPTIVENLKVDRAGPVYVDIVRDANSEPEPLETTPDGQPKQFSPDNLPEEITAVRVIIRAVDGQAINPEDVSGKICSEGETTYINCCYI